MGALFIVLFKIMIVINVLYCCFIPIIAPSLNLVFRLSNKQHLSLVHQP